MTDTTSTDKSGGQPYQAEWSTWTRRVAVLLLGVLLLLLILFFGPVLRVTILALILTYVLYFPVRFVARRTRMSYPLSTILVFLLYLLIITGLMLGLAVPLAGESNQLAQKLKTEAQQYYKFLQNYSPDQGWLHNPRTGQQTVNLNFVLQPVSDMVKSKAGSTDAQTLLSGAGFLMGAVGQTLNTVGGALGSTLLVNLLALLFLLQIPAASRWVIDILPDKYRREYGILGQRIGHKWNNFFKAAVITALLLGVVNTIQMLILGIPSALVVGFLSTILGLIPIIGGLISLVIIVLVALVEGSTTLDLNPLTVALIAGGINLVIQSVVWHVVFPLLSKDAVALPLPVIVMGVIAGVAAGGILGAFLVTPLLGILREIVEYTLKKIQGGDPYPDQPEPGFLSGET